MRVDNNAESAVRSASEVEGSLGMCRRGARRASNGLMPHRKRRVRRVLRTVRSRVPMAGRSSVL